jgi:hypothetical protein
MALFGPRPREYSDSNYWRETVDAESRGFSQAPSEYEIRVAEALDGAWSGTFESLALSYDTGAKGRRVTVLTGALDQAALAGVLDVLFGLGLTVLSVRACEYTDASF